VSYRDYIALERRAMASQESIAFWKQLLEGHRATPVPLAIGRRGKDGGRIPAEESGEVLCASDCSAGRDAGAVAASGARDGVR